MSSSTLVIDDFLAYPLIDALQPNDYLLVERSAGQYYRLTSSQFISSLQPLMNNIPSGVLLGRYSAGMGAFQNVSIGTDLQLTGNTLSVNLPFLHSLPANSILGNFTGYVSANPNTIEIGTGLILNAGYLTINPNLTLTSLVATNLTVTNLNSTNTSISGNLSISSLNVSGTSTLGALSSTSGTFSALSAPAATGSTPGLVAVGAYLAINSGVLSIPVNTNNAILALNSSGKISSSFINFGTVSNTVADGGALASEIVRAEAAEATKLTASNNLIELTNTTTARSNLGLGNLSTQSSSAISVAGGAINGTTIGLITPAAGTFTNLSATHLDNAIIGGTTPAAGSFTTLNSSGATALGAVSATSINNTPIGQTTPAPGKFTGLVSTGTTALGVTSATSIDNTPIGINTPVSGKFTTLSVTNGVTISSGGANFQSQYGTNNTDLSKHISLYSTTYGFNVTANVLNYVAPSGAAHTFVVNSITIATINSNGLSVSAINSSPIGGTTPAAGSFTTLNSSGLTSLGAVSATSINSTPIGASTPAAGKFTTLSATTLDNTVIGSITPANGTFTNIVSNYLNTNSLQSGGHTINPVLASSITDLSKQINLYSNTYGFNVFSSALNYVVPVSSSHVFVVNGTSVATINSGGIQNTVIGSSTPAAGSFTNLAVSGTLSGTGITNALAPYAPINNPTFTGIPSVPTAVLTTNNNQAASTAFVHGLITQNTSGVATFNSRYGTVTLTSSDVTTALGYTPLSSASVNLTGTPTAPTPTQNTNTTQIATAAFVLNQAGTASPLINGTAAVGVSYLYARQDHVHPTDTSRAPVNNPNLTGTVTVPTVSTSDSSTSAANTSWVKSLLVFSSASIGAAGSNQATAQALANSYTVVANITSGNGIILPSSASGILPYTVLNRSGSTILLYPPIGSQIESQGTNNPIDIVNGGSAMLFSSGGSQWYVV